MARIQKAYENKFRAILGSIGTRQFDKAVQWLRARAEKLARQRKVSTASVMAELYEGARQRLEGWRQRRRPNTSLAPAQPGDAPRFLCDAGLGGLARWLRAAGYEARWVADVADDELLREAQRWPGFLLTTDSMLMERRVLRDGIIRSLWVSPAMNTQEQLRAVLRELHLPLRPARCMSCGGSLAAADKESLRERIPPKTYRWRNEFFVCQDCGKLFWHGTHWEKIQRHLKEAGGE